LMIWSGVQFLIEHSLYFRIGCILRKAKYTHIYINMKQIHYICNLYGSQFHIAYLLVMETTHTYHIIVIVLLSMLLLLLLLLHVQACIYSFKH
jgi:hypothetical protein